MYYEEFNNSDINSLSNLNFNFVLNERFIYVTDNDGNYFSCQTPFLKVLKPMHITLNKKKTIAKKYLILETNDELDFNNQIGEFMFIINKIHEISQENIKKKSLVWFNTEFDDIALDIKVRRPIDQQKDSEFIRISIPKNKEIDENISNLSKGNYVLCNVIFKGLKISNDCINEEWEIVDFITQENYEKMYNEENKEDIIQSILSNAEISIVEVNENTGVNENLEVNQDLEVNENLSKEDSKEDNIEFQETNELQKTNELQENIINEKIEVINIKKEKQKKEKIIKEKNIGNKIIENKLKKKNLTKTDLIKKFSKKIIFT